MQHDIAAKALMKAAKALAMIFLIITIPIHISMAYSGALSELTVTTTSGKDKLAMRTDTLDVSVNGWLKDDAGADVPLTDYVYINMPGVETKMSCSGTACTYSTGERDFDPMRYDIGVTLVDPYGRTVDSANSYVYADARAPTIDSLEVPKITTGTFTVKYKVHDTACTDCGSFCSGLDRLEFTVDGTIVQALEGLTGCTKSGSISMTSSSQGNVEVCMTAYDIFGMSSKKCGSSSIDSKAPEVGTVTIKINNESVTYASADPLDVVIEATLDKDAVSVIGDFIDFYPGKSSYSSMVPTCTQSSSSKICAWQVTIYGLDGTATARINVTDSLGNSQVISKSFTLKIDKTPPVVTAINEGKTAIAKNPHNFTVEINDAESGMAGKNILLDLHQIGGGAEVAPDICKKDGNWFCTWYDVGAIGDEGKEVSIRVMSAADDAGNSWNEAGSQKSAKFIIDGTMPVVHSIKISPLGSGLGVLRVDDVASIKAIIEENVALHAEHVLADMSDLTKDAPFYKADECEKLNDTFYECRWEYGGKLEPGEVKLNIIAEDMAGNRKDSANDHVYGEISVNTIVEKKVDYWSGASSYDINSLNRNFLWMSSSGTYIRAGLSLVGKGSTPYVHGFDITECRGTLVGEKSEDEYEPYTISDQFYFADDKRSEKYVLIGIPNYDKTLVQDAQSVRIICQGEVIQGSSVKSAIFSPNEIVNTTFEVELAEKNFEAPDISTIDKITKKEDEIETIEQWITWIEWWVDFLKPLCTMMSLIMQVINGTCTIIEGFNVMYNWMTGGTADPSGCFLQSSITSYIWGEYGGGTQLMDTGITANKKKMLSLGFVCDLVNCEYCGEFWSGLSGKMIGEQWNNQMWKDVPANIRPNFAFDPQKSLFVAVLCWPPCLTGILAKLQAYRTILVTYNTCMNVAAVRGEDLSQCDDYYSSQVCQQIVGEFWYLVDSLVKQVIINMIMSAIKDRVLKLSECPDGWQTESALRMRCYAGKLLTIAGWFLTILDTLEKIEQIMSHEWLSSKEIDQGAKKRLSESG